MLIGVGGWWGRGALTWTGYASFVLIGCNAVLVPSLIRSIEDAFHQRDAAFGLYYLIGALVYASGSFSGGFLVEHLGRRTILGAAGLLCGAGVVGEATAPSWVLFLLAALPVSWGAGAIDGGVNGLFLDLYREARGGALNLLHFFFGAGALTAPFLVGRSLAAGVPWRASMVVTGSSILLLGVAFVALDMPSGRHSPSRVATEAYAGRERALLPFAGLAVGICFYVAAEMAVSGWLVKFLADVPVTTATAVLSVFWGGLALGRLLSNWIAERVDYVTFTVGCIGLASGSLLAALLVPAFGLSAVLFGLAGMFYGPVFPMIVAIGGNLYPHRIAALSGSLGAAAVSGSVIYPPLIGLMASHIGLRAGLIGAALLGLPAALAVIAAYASALRVPSSEHEEEATVGAAL